jgi:predicted exporter
MKRSAPWLALLLLAIATITLRLNISFDISAFFPADTELTHAVLLEQFQNGPGSRILVVGIRGVDEERLVDISDQMRTELKADARFSAVMNGELSEDIDALPEPVASYFLLMRDVDYTREALQAAIDARLRDLALGGGSALLKLFARDPFIHTLDILDRLAPASMTGDMWFAADGSAVLMLETRASAVDIAAQADAVRKIQEVFSKLTDSDQLVLDITGAGAFGVELKKIIRAEAQKRSILASIALLLVLFVFYRSPRYLLLASLPIGMGYVVGLAAVSLLFDSVHGITLAFGFTLMGVAIDYPLHLFSHTQDSAGETAMQRIWPTMRLGALSTALAYMALAFSGSNGLAQLGVFTAAGILVAVLVTKTWLPTLLGTRAMPTSKDAPMSPVALRYLPALLVLLLAAVATGKLTDNGLWDDSLSSISPVPPERLLRDNVLRSAAGTPDMRYQIIMHNSSLESLLSESERVDEKLRAASEDGLLDSWQSVTQLLASTVTQRRRQAAIPDNEALRELLADLLADSPFRTDAFDAFAVVAGRSAELPLLTPEIIRDTALKSWLDSRLIRVDEQWVAMVSVSNPSADALAARVSAWGDSAAMMDLRDSSAELMRDYRGGAVTTVSIAALLILAMLWYQRRQILQVIWITLTVAAVLVATIMIVVLLHGQLTVIHLVALLLVMGLGLDYALFLSRTESAGERRATDKAVLACAVSTTLAFGLLAGSSIPVLKFLGLTVAAGSALSYGIAVAGSRLGAQAASSDAARGHPAIQ